MTCLLYCIDICTDGAKAIVIEQKSRQWHQMILVVIVFFIAMHPHLKKMQVSLKNVHEIVKIINFIKSQPFLSAHLYFYISDNTGNIHKAVVHDKVWWLSQGKHSCLSGKLN